MDQRGRETRERSWREKLVGDGALESNGKEQDTDTTNTASKVKPETNTNKSAFVGKARTDVAKEKTGRRQKQEGESVQSSAIFRQPKLRQR